MTGRILKILLALSVVLVIVWIVSKTHFETVEVPARLKGDAVTNPFYGAIRFSKELGVEASWERVFSTPRSDAVVLLSSWNWDLSRNRRERIENWVEGGGRLILDDSMIGDTDEFERWSGIGILEPDLDEDEDESESTFREGAEDKVEDEDETEADDVMPQWDPSSLEQYVPTDCMALAEDGGNRKISVCDVGSYRSLTTSRKILWALRDGEKIHALRTAVGRGSVTVINASPFRYRGFLAGDHPKLFAAAAQLHHRDLVMFFTEEEHASLVSLMWRFGAPAVLLLLACVVLALWRSIPRFGPSVASTQLARRSLAEQIRGTGLFALRFGSGRALHAASARALRDVAIRRFPRYDHMSSEERMATLSRASGLSADDLGPAMNNIGVRSSHELRQAIAVLETARRRLLLKKAKHGN